MSVVINEFEITPEPPQAEAEADNPSTIAPPRLRPEDLRRMMRREHERQARVLAH